MARKLFAQPQKTGGEKKDESGKCNQSLDATVTSSTVAAGVTRFGESCLTSRTSPSPSPAWHSQSIRRNLNSFLPERSSERVLLWSREERTRSWRAKIFRGRNEMEKCLRGEYVKTRCQSITCAVVNDGTGPAGALKTDNLTQFRD